MGAIAVVQRQPEVSIISGRMSGIHDGNLSDQGITATPFPGHDIRVEVPIEPRIYHRRGHWFKSSTAHHW
jgi:hypothetical protein